MGSLMFRDTTMESETYSALGLYELSGKGSSTGTTPRIILLLSSVLERSILKNEKLLKTSKVKDAITIFHGTRPPSLSIRRYIERIFKYSKCSNSCFVVAYIYIEMFLQSMKARITSLNAHRLLITSIMVAAKFLDDECYNNAHYAKVGGVNTEEMNRMEINFLFNLDFRLHVTSEIFRTYCLKLEKEYANVGEKYAI